MRSHHRTSKVELSPGKRRLFVFITLATPFLLLLLIELLLRLVHYGPDLSLFRTETIRGQQYLVMNPEVKGRYFYQVEFNPSTSLDFFQNPKSPGTYRIFCLGASTTVGYPYWFNGSFSTFLRDRLRAFFPRRNIEVINLGMTATNSYTVTDIARELPEYQPDCIIVYDGHNEFYGAMGIASHESLGRSRWFNRLYLRIVHFRSFLLLRDGASLLSGLFRKSEAGLPPATMMEQLSRGQYVPYGGQTYREGLDVFKENLAELREICARANIPLILSTQVSNLRRQPPFISRSSTPVQPGDEMQFNLAINDGISKTLDGNFGSALATFQSITGPGKERADLHFHIAQCLDTLAHSAQASREYALARDLDQLRFRASSDFNEAIRSMEDGKQLFVADVENVFAAASPDSLIGSEFITEHLHPNLRGHFMIGRLYAGMMRAHGMIADSQDWRGADTLSEEQLWNGRNATLLDEMIAAKKTAILTSGWPFRDQPPTVPPVSANDTLGQIVERVTRDRIDWERAHLEAAALYARHADSVNAIREYQVVAAEIPFDAAPLLLLGNFLVATGKTNEGREAYLKSLQREETAQAYGGLGRIALSNGALREAMSDFEHSVRLSHTPEERAGSQYVLALLYLRSGDRERAVQELKEVVKATPANRQAAELLARLAQQ